MLTADCLAPLVLLEQLFASQQLIEKSKVTVLGPVVPKPCISLQGMLWPCLLFIDNGSGVVLFGYGHVNIRVSSIVHYSAQRPGENWQTSCIIPTVRFGRGVCEAVSASHS